MTVTKTQKQAEAELLAEIERRGLRIEYGSRPTKYVRVYGPGVDVKATRIGYISVRGPGAGVHRSLTPAGRAA